MLHFECPDCGKESQAPVKYAGRKVKCKGCQAMFRLPEMQWNSLKLDAGTMEIVPADDTILATVAESWPYPLRRMQYDERELGNVQFEFPFSSEDGSSFGVALALQAPLKGTDAQLAVAVANVNRILLAGAVAAIHRLKPAGLVFPISGLLQAEEGPTPVLAFFIRSWTRHGEAPPPAGGAFDEKLGPGTTHLFNVAMQGLQETVNDERPFLGVAELGIGSPDWFALRWCDFFYLHGEVYSVKQRMTRGDPGWDILYQNGVRRVVAMPMRGCWPTNPAGPG